MKAIELYLLFVISLAGMILCDDPFSKENRNNFLRHVFDLHNSKRLGLNLPSLLRNNYMDKMAYKILFKKLFNYKYTVPENYGVNSYMEVYDNNFKLDHTLAKTVFDTWQSGIINSSFCKEQQRSILEASLQIMWESTKDIGLAVGQNDENYGVLVLYFPRYDSSAPGQITSDKSTSSTIDQGGPSTIYL